MDLTKAFVNFRPLEYAPLVSLGRVGPEEPAVEGVGRSKKPPVKSLKRDTLHNYVSFLSSQSYEYND